MITQKYLKSILKYNQNTGIFIWIAARKKIRVGDVAGRRKPKGYVDIKIDQRSYKAHRLAWVYVKGIWPKHQLDHKNKIKSDNRWRNLREATNGQNQANKFMYKNNSTGAKGVQWSQRKKKWLVYIKTKGKVINLGGYENFNTAKRIYKSAAKKYHGKFAHW